MDGDDDVTQPVEPAASIGGLAHARYKLGAPIGRGGQGEVIAATDTQIGREVAIKRMTAANPTQAAMGRFFREASIQGRLDHPSIVPIYELGVDADGRPFFAMKKLAGTTLSQRIRAGEQRQRLLRAFAEVCLAIEFAHARGVVHRDLKPDNILIGDFGEVYVLDWGVAKRAGDVDDPGGSPSEDPLTTSPGAAIGTRAYMAPEQEKAAHEADARSDVFSLGAILYEILTGAALYRRPATASEPVDVPPELDTLWRHATARERHQRIASARELGEGVQRFLDGDRDLALRKDLARKHLDRARAAADTGDRRLSLREAGRAIVLDPTPEAATLVGHLMLERPRELPEEVERAVADQDRAQELASLRASRWASLGFLWLLPSIIAMLQTEPRWALALFAMPLANSVLSFGIPPGRARTAAVIAGNSLWVALLGHVFSPFLFAPCFAAVVTMSIASGPQVKTTRAAFGVAASLAGAILLTWLGEAAGVLQATTVASANTLALDAPGFHTPGAVTFVVLALWVVVALFGSASVGFARRRTELQIRRELELRAWQLRQLFPA